MAKDRRLLLFLESTGLDPTKVHPVVIHKNNTGRRATAKIQFYLLDEHGGESVLPASDGSTDPFEVSAENGYWKSPAPWNLDDYKQHGYRSLRIKSPGCDYFDVQLTSLTEPRPSGAGPSGTAGNPASTEPIPDHVTEPIVTRSSDKPTERAVTFIVQDKGGKPCPNAMLVITRNGQPGDHKAGSGGVFADIFDIPLGASWDYAVTVVESGKTRQIVIKGDPLPKSSGIPAPLVASKVNFVNGFPVPGTAGTHTVTVDVVTDVGELVADTAFEVLVEGQPAQTERSNASGTASFNVAIATTGKRKIMFRIPGKALSAPIELDGPPAATPAPPAPEAVKVLVISHHADPAAAAGTTSYIAIAETQGADDKPVGNAPYQLIVQGQPPKSGVSDAQGCVTEAVTFNIPGTFSVQFRIPGYALTAPISLDGPPAPTPAPPPTPDNWVLTESHPPYPIPMGASEVFVSTLRTMNNAVLARKQVQARSSALVTVSMGGTNLCVADTLFNFELITGEDRLNVVIEGDAEQASITFEANGAAPVQALYVK